MFCDRCGASLQQGQNFCSGCGKPVETPLSSEPSRIQTHIRLLAILWFVVSACILLPGLFLLGFSAQLVNMLPPEAPEFVAAILPVAGIFISAIAAVGFLAGWGLLERAPWARTLAIILACFSLIHVPLGTALGVYTLWVLLPAKSEQEYRRAARLDGAGAFN